MTGGASGGRAVRLCSSTSPVGWRAVRGCGSSTSVGWRATQTSGRVFGDGPSLREIVKGGGLAEPWREPGVTRVVGIEARGGSCSRSGDRHRGSTSRFVAIRKSDTSLLPGPKVRATAAEDYRGIRHNLRMQSVLTADDRVLLVDDWAKNGVKRLRACRGGGGGPHSPGPFRLRGIASRRPPPGPRRQGPPGGPKRPQPDRPKEELLPLPRNTDAPAFSADGKGRC